MRGSYLTGKNGILFAVSIRRATAQESQGMWDWRVLVSRLAPTYAHAFEWVSGGRGLAEGVADSMMERLLPPLARNK